MSMIEEVKSYQSNFTYPFGRATVVIATQQQDSQWRCERHIIIHNHRDKPTHIRKVAVYPEETINSFRRHELFEEMTKDFCHIAGSDMALNDILAHLHENTSTNQLSNPFAIRLDEVGPSRAFLAILNEGTQELEQIQENTKIQSLHNWIRIIKDAGEWFINQTKEEE